MTAVAWTLTLVGGGALPLVADATTGAPGAPATARVAAAPVLDVAGQPLVLTAPVLDLVLTISNLGGSLTDANGPKRRVLTLAADVLFDFGKAELVAAASSRLSEVAGDIRTAAAHGPLVLHVDGYTDALGTVAYNAALSTSRAGAVATALRKLLPGVGVTFLVQGHGAADPVAPNTLRARTTRRGELESGA